MPQGEELRKLEKEKGIIMRFVIGHRNLRTRLNKSRKSKSDEPKFH
ncbi:hypothetical protein RGQ29_020177 [Quercus rubra]|uniref:Uncharacterized protein n=1 Tax=Quercus rubra TaxID=3512 RepID=A0AAN7FFR2_QUERU|nr:hypothetical protein RGQ29_020177 [Quercus rubra]